MQNKKLSKRFCKNFILLIKKQNNFDFSKNTTYGCGGIAKIAYFPKNTIEAICVFEKTLQNNLKFCILGNGSNVLASQNFFDGVVVCTKYFKGIFKKSNKKIYCLAGTTVQEILNYCIKNELGGLEFLYKIPATIGGLALMNGGAGGIYLKNCVKNIKIYTTKIQNFDNYKCNFSYKYSTMQDIMCLILGVELEILPSSTMQITEKLNLVAKNRAHLPKGKSCGCVFKNCFKLNKNIYAGQLIEDCGLKGYKIGCAEVSKIHSNFIINYGKNSLDVYNLIQFVKEVVYAKKGILLEEEVKYIGEF